MNNSQTNKKLELGGETLFQIIEGGAKALEKNVDKINTINVFPVPDGDTGTNMFLTLNSILDDLKDYKEYHAGKLAKKMYDSALLGSRGNSGLILTQFFKGMTQSILNEKFLPENFLNIFKFASENSLNAIPNPESGTMITVYSDCAKKINAIDNKDISYTLEILSSQAIDTVKKTPTMLSVLREANVVDSGAFGLAVMLIGALDVIKNKGDGNIDVNIPIPDFSEMGNLNEDFLEGIKEEIWGYCTVFAIKGKKLNFEKIKDQISKIGKSTVVAGNESIIKIHTHVDNPGNVISLGASMGILSNIEIKNMDEQTNDWANNQKIVTKDYNPTILSVAHGDGIIKLMKEINQNNLTIIPINKDRKLDINYLVQFIEKIQSTNIIFLPNDKNIFENTKEIINLTKKNLSIIPSVSISSGIACIFAFEENSSIDKNIENMNQSLNEIITADVYKNSPNKFIGRIDGKIVVTDSTPDKVLKELIKQTSTKDSLVTIYTKIKKDTKIIEDFITHDTNNDFEIEIIYGGQYKYDYLLSIE